MASHRSSSSGSEQASDEGVKLGYHDMLSYGHKPGDSDYHEQKQALEKAFTKADRQASSGKSSSKQSSARASKGGKK